MTKTVLITGASGGIGAAIAERFSRDGYNLILHYNNNREKALEIAKKLSSSCRAVTVKADITKPDEIETMRRYAEKVFGGADIVINNAGVSSIGLLTGCSIAEVDRLIDTNLKGALYVCRAFIPYMVNNRWGKIVNISSMWGISGASCEAAYSAAKAGLTGLTKALAKELGPSGINVNCVAPGYIDTDMNSGLSKDTIAALVDSTPLGRIGLPGDIAGAVYFLSSDEASFITGQTLTVDGGMVL